MALKDHIVETPGLSVLQRSLERGRLGHAYLFTGNRMETLEEFANTLARVLNCLEPVTVEGHVVDSCDQCIVCRKIQHHTHGDIQWVRPESKSRQISVDQMREVIREMQLKSGEAKYKVGVVVYADRMNANAANAFLKTLEEPPPNSVLILLTTEPQRLLETVVSRCLRINFTNEGAPHLDEEQAGWLREFGAVAAREQKSLMTRYRLLDELVKKLSKIREETEAALEKESPMEEYDDLEPALKERWEKELTAAVESEYRRRRAEMLSALQWWLRDVWVCTLKAGKELLQLPESPDTAKVAARLSTKQAVENIRTMEETQRLLHTNVQESLALEIGLLKLHL